MSDCLGCRIKAGFKIHIGSQSELYVSMRRILVDWLIEIHLTILNALIVHTVMNLCLAISQSTNIDLIDHSTQVVSFVFLNTFHSVSSLLLKLKTKGLCNRICRICRYLRQFSYIMSEGQSERVNSPLIMSHPTIVLLALTSIN